MVRVNAHALHEAVLREIHRVVEHPTRTAEVIRDAVKALPQPENREAELKAIARRLREADQKISRLTAVVESSGSKMAIRPLLSHMKELEQQRLSLEQERQRLEREIAASRLNRPDAAQVQRLWGRVLELWDAATEAERVQLMGLLVERVEMKDKEHGF